MQDKIVTIELDEYRRLVVEEMVRLGANENDLALLCDAMLRNSIRIGAKPQDVAWAILE